MDFEKWFEELSRLAREDPEAFEARRQELIEEVISQVPEERQERLRRFQWRIDMERKRAKTPLGACIKLNDMLMEMVYGEGGFTDAVNTLKGIAEELAGALNPFDSDGPELNSEKKLARDAVKRDVDETRPEPKCSTSSRVIKVDFSRRCKRQN